MSRGQRLIRRMIKDQSGFTLLELLIATALGVMVIGIGATVFTVAGHNQPAQVKRGVAIQQARITMERITREIRQGSTVYASTAAQLSLITYVHSATCGGSHADTAIQCRVTYTCTATSCTRTEGSPPPATDSGSPATVVSGLSGPNVFSYTPSCDATSTSGDPGYVCVTLAFPGGQNDDAITLQDGATPINSS
jgi:prepilin-type N-terminal cleavage/methylation domain-containing protein